MRAPQRSPPRRQRAVPPAPCAAVAALGDREAGPQHRGTQAEAPAADLGVGVHTDQLGQFVVAQDRLRQHDLLTRRLGGVEQVAFGAQRPCRLVTISSRMASNGGLVTWANFCWK